MSCPPGLRSTMTNQHTDRRSYKKPLLKLKIDLPTSTAPPRSTSRQCTLIAARSSDRLATSYTIDLDHRRLYRQPDNDRQKRTIQEKDTIKDQQRCTSTVISVARCRPTTRIDLDQPTSNGWPMFKITARSTAMPTCTSHCH